MFPCRKNKNFPAIAKTFLSLYTETIMTEKAENETKQSISKATEDALVAEEIYTFYFTLTAIMFCAAKRRLAFSCAILNILTC